jgi:ppGpp synthetase/RelA/SpoT-type nucleotidyltranferase
VALENDPWIKNPDVIRRFLAQKPDYERLGKEVAYILEKLLERNSIKVLAVSSRSKELTSFLEKVARKSYQDPFTEITDFSGVRVVCFYSDELPLVETLIDNEFQVVEKENKNASLDVDRFGYSARHFLVRLGERSVGVRYDDIREKICEIQVRTVLEDAWAVFSHHLMYKNESEIPDHLKREIYALAGALSTADTAFLAIRDKRNRYIETVRDLTRKDALGGISTDLDSLTTYLEQKFPDVRIGGTEGSLSTWFDEGLFQNYPTLRDIENLLERTKLKRKRFEKWYYSGTKEAMLARPSSWELFIALCMENPEIASRWYVIHVVDMLTKIGRDKDVSP